MIVAGSEPKAFRDAASQVSNYPEAHGCDALFVVRGQYIGIQRKEISDLFASVTDRRLKRQMDMMGALHAAYVIIEGAPRFTLEGKLMGDRTKQGWTRDKYMGIIVSIQNRGVKVLHSADLQDTIHLCAYLEAWHGKDSHSLIDGSSRSSMSTLWGAPTHQEFGQNFLEGLPGIGPKIAKALYEKFGLPFALTVTEAELKSVPGIGPKLAKRIVRALSGEMKPRELVK